MSLTERAGPGDVVVTADIPLADRCLKRGARVLGPRGDVFTEDSIGEALATRDLLDMLRQSGQNVGGPAAFARADRARFLSRARRGPPRHPARSARPRSR